MSTQFLSEEREREGALPFSQLDVVVSSAVAEVRPRPGSRLRALTLFLRPPLVFSPSAGPKNPSYAQRVQSIPASTCMFLKSRCLLPDYSVLFNRHPDQQQLASSAYKRGLYCRSIRVYRQVLTLCSIGRQSGSSGFRFLFTYVRFFCALSMYTKSLFQLASYGSPSNQIRRYELGNQKRMMILDLYHYTL